MEMLWVTASVIIEIMASTIHYKPRHLPKGHKKI